MYFLFIAEFSFRFINHVLGAVPRTVKDFNSPLGPGLASQIFGMDSGIERLGFKPFLCLTVQTVLLR